MAGTNVVKLEYSFGLDCTIKSLRANSWKKFAANWKINKSWKTRFANNQKFTIVVPVKLSLSSATKATMISAATTLFPTMVTTVRRRWLEFDMDCCRNLSGRSRSLRLPTIELSWLLRHVAPCLSRVSIRGLSLSMAEDSKIKRVCILEDSIDEKVRN